MTTLDPATESKINRQVALAFDKARLRTEARELASRLEYAEAVCEALNEHEHSTGSWDAVLSALDGWLVSTGDKLPDTADDYPERNER